MYLQYIQEALSATPEACRKIKITFIGILRDEIYFNCEAKLS
jgi:hypothetical protein